VERLGKSGRKPESPEAPKPRDRSRFIARSNEMLITNAGSDINISLIIEKGKKIF